MPRHKLAQKTRRGTAGSSLKSWISKGRDEAGVLRAVHVRVARALLANRRLRNPFVVTVATANGLLSACATTTSIGGTDGAATTIPSTPISNPPGPCLNKMSIGGPCGGGLVCGAFDECAQSTVTATCSRTGTWETDAQASCPSPAPPAGSPCTQCAGRWPAACHYGDCDQIVARCDLDAGRWAVVDGSCNPTEGGTPTVGSDAGPGRIDGGDAGDGGNASDTGAGVESDTGSQDGYSSG